MFYDTQNHSLLLVRKQTAPTFGQKEIKLWNESNFDVNIIPYVKEAYKAKRYAFVSDYVRYWALYNYGGVYFDTDVELIKPVNQVLTWGGIWGLKVLLTVKIYM